VFPIDDDTLFECHKGMAGLALDECILVDLFFFGAFASERREFTAKEPVDKQCDHCKNNDF
jgi:hypothetical protein